MILCTGGHGADTTEESLLALYRPDYVHQPTSNGVHHTGDGSKMSEAIGEASDKTSDHARGKTMHVARQVARQMTTLVVRQVVRRSCGVGVCTNMGVDSKHTRTHHTLN